MSEKSVFTAMGLSGSGKTCYVLGLFDAMASGIHGFTLDPQDQTRVLLDWAECLHKRKGNDRFPVGTSNSEFTRYNFKLKHNFKQILSFEWADYAGGLLKNMDESEESYANLTKSIDLSTVLYVVVDGNLLLSDSHEDRVENVKLECGNIINRFIGIYAESHNQCLPPIVFIVTKVDLLASKVNDSEIVDVIKESFSACFGDGHRTYICGVSLGLNISDDNYNGKVKPFHIHIPMFIGIFHDFYNYCLWLNKKIEIENLDCIENIKNMDEDIKSYRDEFEKQSKKWLFKDKNQIRNLDEQIQLIADKRKENEDVIEYNKRIKESYKKLMLFVAEELTRHCNDFAVFEDGKQIEFTVSNCYDL